MERHVRADAQVLDHQFRAARPCFSPPSVAGRKPGALMTISRQDFLDAAILSQAAYAATSNALISQLSPQGWTVLGADELGLSPFLFGVGFGDSNYLYDNGNAQGFIARKG